MMRLFEFSQLIQCWQKWQYWHQGIQEEQKKIPTSGVLPDARDYYWFKSPSINLLVGVRLLDLYIVMFY